jgi:hypothetical protein
MFCTNCGLKLGDETKFCPNCGAKRSAPQEAPENKSSLPSEDFSRESKNIIPFWLFLVIGLFLVFVAGLLIASAGNQSQPTNTQPTQSASQPTRTTTPSPLGNGETVAACKELKPILEENFKKVGTRFPDADSDRALGAILLSVNSVARNYSVNGLFAETSVPLGLRNFSEVIERTIALTFDGAGSVLVWTQFLDSLQGDVREPCGQVGVAIILTTE